MALTVASVGDRLPVLGQRLIFTHWKMPPATGPRDNRNDADLAGGLALQGDLHLLVAVVGGDEVGAEQQQYDVGALQVLVDPAFPFLPGSQAAVVPGVQIALS